MFAFAQQFGVGAIEDFGLRLGRHFVDGFDWVTGAKVSIDEHGWDRIGADPHAFTRAGGGTRTAVVTIDGDEAYVLDRAHRPRRAQDDRLGVHRLPA